MAGPWWAPLATAQALGGVFHCHRALPIRMPSSTAHPHAHSTLLRAHPTRMLLHACPLVLLLRASPASRLTPSPSAHRHLACCIPRPQDGPARVEAWRGNPGARSSAAGTNYPIGLAHPPHRTPTPSPTPAGAHHPDWALLLSRPPLPVRQGSARTHAYAYAYAYASHARTHALSRHARTHATRNTHRHTTHARAYVGPSDSIWAVAPPLPSCFTGDHSRRPSYRRVEGGEGRVLAAWRAAAACMQLAPGAHRARDEGRHRPCVVV